MDIEQRMKDRRRSECARKQRYASEAEARATADHQARSTGKPGESSLGGDAFWDAIPGARGCTPQGCGFRDLHGEFRALGVTVAGVSTQTTEYQREFVERNHVPFDLLSDAELRLTHALKLPTFEFGVEGIGPSTLIKRMAWYVEGGRIARVWYPVFPPDKNADVVLSWLRDRRA